MKRIVTEHFICQNCLNADPLPNGKAGMVWCSVIGRVLPAKSTYCDSWVADTSAFTWHPHICLTIAIEMENVQ